ncbi:hypothetical protein ACLOJK_020219, partial [Asimina triloba]
MESRGFGTATYGRKISRDGNACALRAFILYLELVDDDPERLLSRPQRGFSILSPYVRTRIHLQAIVSYEYGGRHAQDFGWC